MIDSEYITQIIDYLNFQRYHLETPVDAEGRRTGPNRAAQPNLSMKGRTADSLLRDSEEWHFYINLNRKRVEQEQRIARAQGYTSYSQQNLTWERTPNVKEFFKTEGNKEKNTLVTYSIVEILNSKGLRDEGAAMSHCVGSYSNACVTGRSSIFSLRMVMHGLSERLVTIEINKPTLTIVQARGLRNHAPDKKDRQLIIEWANKNGLTLSRWF